MLADCPCFYLGDLVSLTVGLAIDSAVLIAREIAVDLSE